ncbi:hypothetical protein BH09BAC3_BH09BAC3_35340 [soil metagenome]
MTVYNDTNMIEQPIYGSSRLGQYIGGGREGKEILGLRKYELTNHLGNVLSTITDNVNMNGAGNIIAKVESTSDYYPFGLEMTGRAWKDPAVNYRYGFNGKEKDASTEWGDVAYDYGFRIYNPGLGKFLSVDPLTGSYPWYTPYQFAGNKPIWAIDLDGLEELINPLQSREFMPVMNAPTRSEAVENAVNNVLIFLPKVAVEIVNDGIGLINYSYGVTTGQRKDISGVQFTAVIEDGIGREIKRVSKLSSRQMLDEFVEGATDLNTYSEATKFYVFSKIKIPEIKTPKVTPPKSTLESRAKAIHSLLDSRAQQMRTTAVTEAVSAKGEIFNVIGSSEDALTVAQRAALLPGEIPAFGVGHAEETTINTAKRLNLKPTRTAASRDICPDCSHSMYETGSKPASPVQQN